MKKLTDLILFTIFISLPMVMLDAIYHLGTETAVHVNYMLVKLTLIFLILFLVTWLAGKGFNQGLFAVITGPVIFYFYYLFADATLNREIFKIDENFGYIFLHILVFAISYFLVYFYIYKKQGSREIKALSTAFILTLTTLALDIFYQMGKIQLATHNEEIVAETLSFDTTLYLFFILFVISFLFIYYVKNKIFQMILFVIFSALSIQLIDLDLSRTLAGILIAGISVFLLSYYSENSNVKSSKGTSSNNKLFSIIFAVTAIIGLLYLFIPYKILKNSLNLALGLGHNDHVMIGAVSITLAVSCLYKLFVSFRE